MIARFRNLSLTAKLLLLGIIPILFLIYFSTIIYREKSQKLELLGNYIEHVKQSENTNELMAELSGERRFSYFYIIYDTGYNSLLIHRHRTDSIIQLLEKNNDFSLRDFPKYTFLDELDTIRAAIDSKKITTGNIMQYYTYTVFRINLLSPFVPANTFLKPAYKDLVAQEKLSEMITYLGIIRTNIFNVLLTGKGMNETLFGMIGVYKVFNTYETEFLIKAPPESKKRYEDLKKRTDYGVTLDYLNRLFSSFKFDSTYTADQFWNVSTEAMVILRNQQRTLWNSADTKMQQIYNDEKDSKKGAISFLLFAVLLVIAFVAYVIIHVRKVLEELKIAAAKISKGGTGLQLNDMPKGIITNLAKSIIDIDKNNLALAQAANQIGKGNFEVNVKLRSPEDLLGISIKKMRDNLHEFTVQKDKIQKETEDLVYRRDEFFSIASHELKTPVTSLKAYTQLLLMDAEESMDVQHKTMLERMDIQINKLTFLINDLLDISKIENGQLVFNKELFVLNDLVLEIISDMQPVSINQEIIFKNNEAVSVCADRERIRQVISNFISNAVKYASGGKKIIILIERQRHKVICSVQDFGKGISKEEFDNIFERFYRVSGPNLNTYPGLGLGLFICKEVIEKHSGKIGLKSESGKGSTFFFELPINDKDN